MNPFGCVKDRSAWSSLRDLEERDELGNEGGMVEPTSANTGISLVDLLQAWGYRLLAIEPNSVPREKKLLLKIAGAELEIISDGLCLAPRLGDGPINHATTYAEARSHKYVISNQYEDEKTVKAHFRTMGARGMALCSRRHARLLVPSTPEYVSSTSMCSMRCRITKLWPSPSSSSLIGSARTSRITSPSTFVFDC